MVYANDKYAYPNVHMLSMSLCYDLRILGLVNEQNLV